MTTIRAGDATRQALLARKKDVLLEVPGGRRVTGGELETNIQKLAGYLAERDLAGKRIGLSYRNSIAAFEAFLAVERLGATRLPTDPDIPAAEAQAMFDACPVDAVLADREHAPGLTDPIIHDDTNVLAGSAWTDTPEVEPDSTYMYYPRQVASGQLIAVTVSYGNWLATMRINSELFQSGAYGAPFDSDAKLLTMQQLMHGTSFVASFPFLMMGLPQVILARFNAEDALKAIREHQITTTFAVPGMLTRLASALDADLGDLPLRHTLYGGAPLPLSELRRVIQTLGPSLVQLYGRIEAGWPLALLGQAEHQIIADGDDQLGSSCGKVIPQVELRLGPVDNQPEGYGELQTKNAMTSPAFTDPDGWCALGDIAYQSKSGYLFLHGRLDNMINSGSYHIYPRQVEEEIQKDEDVIAVRVRGESDPKWGQAVVAYVVPKPSADWDALIERLNTELPKSLARYKMPKAYHSCTTLPDS